jgi:hypothetical protein
MRRPGPCTLALLEGLSFLLGAGTELLVCELRSGRERW